MVLFMKHGV